MLPKISLHCILNEDSNNVTFFDDEIGILSVDLDKINLDDVNFDEDYPKTSIHVRLLAWHNGLNNKAFQKRNKEGINACSIVSYKKVELVCARRLEKRNRTIFIYEK